MNLVCYQGLDVLCEVMS